MQDDGCRDIDGQIERIRYYEEILSQSEQLLKDGMEPDEDFAGKLRELDEYYGSEDWRKDLASDEAGLLPEDLKRGVLSEDGIYNVLEQCVYRHNDDTGEP